MASVSQRYLLLVAKSGSLYIYTREPLQFLLLIPSNRKVGSIERAIISPNSNYVVLANHKAEIYLQNISSVDGHLADLSAYNKTLPELKFIGTAKSNVTCFYWSEDEKQLFYGDRSGNVCLISVDNFFNGNIFNANINPILLLDNEIVQIDGFDLLLIVSTRTGCILCNSDREEFKQIGNRPRDGQFGACFMNKSIDEYLRGQVICARPGARFWQVDYGGTVKQTIQFKDALNRPPIRPTIDSPSSSPSSSTTSSPTRNIPEKTDYSPEPNKKYSSAQSSLSFGKLIELRVNEEHFLVTYTKSAVYVFDPLASRLILWTDYFDNLCDVFVVNDIVYCISETDSGSSGVSVGRFQVRSKLHVFESLLGSADLSSTKSFIVEHRNYLKAKTVAIAESLRPRMEQTKELLIKDQAYECLEIISHIGYRVEAKGNSEQTVTVLSLRRDSPSSPDSNNNNNNKTRTMIASALRTTFNLFNQATGRGHSPELIRANVGGEVSLKTPQHRLDLFREITTNFTNGNGGAGGGDSDVIVDNKKKFFANRKFKKLSELLKTNENDEGEAVKESKLLKNLFLIYKSSRMGNVSMVERYAPMLDRMTLQEVLALMRKLEALMQDNDYSELEAKQNSTVILLDYLSPSVINEEMDNETLEELIDRYVLVNRTKGQAKSCQTCSFPVEIANDCLYYDFGRTLFEFLYAREDVENYQKLMRNIPHLLHIFIKYYRESSPRDSYLRLLFILRKFSVANQLSGSDWSCLLDLMNELRTNSIVRCFNCGKWNSVGVVDLPEEYSWNYMLNHAARFMSGPALLREVVKHSNAIKSGEVSKQFFLKCLQTA